MAATPRDSTNAELALKIDAVLEALSEIKDQMVTKVVFDTWQQGNDRRITRVEEDLKDWIKISTEAHVSLDKDSQARHKETEAAMDALEIKLQTEIDKAKANARSDHKALRTEVDETRKDAETVKRSRINIWLAAGVAVLGSILTKWFLPDLGG